MLCPKKISFLGRELEVELILPHKMMSRQGKTLSYENQRGMDKFMIRKKSNHKTKY